MGAVNSAADFGLATGNYTAFDGAAAMGGGALAAAGMESIHLQIWAAFLLLLFCQSQSFRHLFAQGSLPKNMIC